MKNSGMIQGLGVSLVFLFVVMAAPQAGAETSSAAVTDIQTSQPATVKPPHKVHAKKGPKWHRHHKRARASGSSVSAAVSDQGQVK
jgi:hypothetical protein